MKTKHRSELTLTLVDEEAMVLETEIPASRPTATVQVNITYKDENGVEYHATRIVKMRVKEGK